MKVSVKMIKLSLYLLSILLTIIAVECVDRNYVWNVYNKAGEEKALLDIKTFRDNYKKSVFDSLEKLPQTVKSNLIEKADKSLKKEWVSKLVIIVMIIFKNYFLNN